MLALCCALLAHTRASKRFENNGGEFTSVRRPRFVVKYTTLHLTFFILFFSIANQMQLCLKGGLEDFKVFFPMASPSSSDCTVGQKQPIVYV